MTASSDPLLWGHKAHALLLPTPLAGSEPDTEASRTREVRELLKDRGLGVSEASENEALHEGARRDAYMAHVPEASAPAAIDRGIRHPLSLRTSASPSIPFGADEWTDLCRHLKESVLTKGKPRENYTALWRYLMGYQEGFGLAQLAGHAIFNDHSLLAHRSAAAALVGARFGGDDAALLHLHIGPVQGFIKAARRTHDLALGSYIVAYLSFHAVEAIATDCGPDAILYPDLATLELFSAARDPHPSSVRRRREHAIRALRASLPNRFMAIVPKCRAEEIARRAASAVSETWKAMAKAVHDKIRKHTRLPPRLNDDEHWRHFDAQIDAHLEIDATIRMWQTQSSNGSYTEVFKSVRDDLGDQRRLITALPPHGSYTGKCTQCGEREQLGRAERRPRFWPELRAHLDNHFGSSERDRPDSGEPRETLDLREGEALCAVCLTKRFVNRWYFGAPGGSLLGLDWKHTESDRLLLRFPSVASIASAPARFALWRSSADPKAWNEALNEAHKELDFTPPGNLLPGLGGPKRTKSNHLDADGSWLYETSYEPETALRDHDSTANAKAREEACERLAEPLGRAREALRELLAATAAQATTSSAADQGPAGSVHVTPYYAVINLDVDCMGKWLDGSHRHSPKRGDFLDTLPDPGERRGLFPALHREISRRQSQLASDQIYRIVEHDHLGRVVYSGGDDLLAFVPLATLWRCLSALHRCFRSDEALGERITISAGVAITHWRAPLSQALHLAREAEEDAKETRNRLVVRVDTRSGVPLCAPLLWEDLPCLHDLSVLAPPTADRPDEEERDAAARLRFNTLEKLERELTELPDTYVGEPARPPPWPTEAIRARVFLHLTGKRPPPVTEALPALLSVIDALSAPRVIRGPGALRPSHAPVLDFLHLLRFLAREHDQVIDDALLARARTDA